MSFNTPKQSGGGQGKGPLCRSIKHQPSSHDADFLFSKPQWFQFPQLCVSQRDLECPGPDPDIQDRAMEKLSKSQCKCAGVSKTSNFLQELLSNLKLTETWQKPDIKPDRWFCSPESRKGNKFISSRCSSQVNSVFLLPLHYQTESNWGRGLCLAGGMESTYRC